MKFVLLSGSHKTTAQENEFLKDEFRHAKRCGEGRLGDRHFFYRYFLRVRYIPYQEIVHAYLREESGESGEFLLKEFYLMLVFTDGKTGKFRFEREVNARAVLSYFEEFYPGIRIGFYKNIFI